MFNSQKYLFSAIVYYTYNAKDIHIYLLYSMGLIIYVSQIESVGGALCIERAVQECLLMHAHKLSQVVEGAWQVAMVLHVC